MRPPRARRQSIGEQLGVEHVGVVPLLLPTQQVDKQRGEPPVGEDAGQFTGIHVEPA